MTLGISQYPPPPKKKTGEIIERDLYLDIVVTHLIENLEEERVLREGGVLQLYI